MQNLLSETRLAIKESGHTPADIVFIGSLESGHRCTWEEFEGLADFPYDAGYGAAHIATDLKIVFRDGSTMWRGEYDGAEWWEFSRPPEIPDESRPIHSLGGNVLWETLAEIHGDD